jgi:hypothetical protein
MRFPEIGWAGFGAVSIEKLKVYTRWDENAELSRRIEHLHLWVNLSAPRLLLGKELD